MSIYVRIKKHLYSAAHGHQLNIKFIYLIVLARLLFDFPNTFALNNTFKKIL